MDWGTLIATVSGGFIAISGTVLADRLRQRHERDREADERRRSVYIEFIAAVGKCHTRLRGIAQAQDPGVDPDLAARAALDEAGVHEVRERFFIDASAQVAGAGQAMFQQLRAVQRIVGSGATHTSSAFHDAYHPYLDLVWAYRVSVRGELKDRAFSPESFGWEAWDGRERCPVCRDRPGRARPPARPGAPDT
ncbi:CchlQ [Streptomyces rubiginosohelvolus]|uniref:CchlQ n=1 Tax=Streptomyces rubiginosohelvolus TaxID=67362 RepID=UPI00339EA288